MGSSFSLCIDSGGTARGVYADDLLPVFDALGLLVVRRASHVEPSMLGGWYADLSPVAGPVLGPYRTRAEALAAELLHLGAETAAGTLPTPTAAAADLAELPGPVRPELSGSRAEQLDGDDRRACPACAGTLDGFVVGVHCDGCGWTLPDS